MSDNQASSNWVVMQQVFDSIPDVIFCKDLEGIYRGGNKAWGDLLGRSVGETLGKTDFELFPKDVAAIFRKNDLEMLASGQPRRNDEWVDYPDGRRVLLDTLKSPVFDEGGKIIGLVGVCRDITGREFGDGNVA